MSYMTKVGKKLKVVNVSTELASPLGDADLKGLPEPTSTPQEIEETPETVEEVLAIIEPEAVKTKPKAKAKSKAKVSLEKVEEETPKEETPKEEEEVKEEEEAPEEGKKPNNVVSKIECLDCGKWLTPKGLKYSHKCPANKTSPKITQSPTTPKVIKKDSKIIKEKKCNPEGIDISKKCSPYGADYSNIPEEIIQQEIEKRRVSQRELRIIKKEEIMKKLSMNIA